MSQDFKSVMKHYIHTIHQFKDQHLTIPSKKATISALKYALNQCTDAQLHDIAKALGITQSSSSSSSTALKLDILDYVQHTIYGHAIQGWNNTARWGFLLVLYYLLLIVSDVTKGDDRWQITKAVHNGTFLVLLMLYLFGAHLLFKLMTKFRHSWNTRRKVQMALQQIHLPTKQKEKIN